jgi:predicted acyltransferase
MEAPPVPPPAPPRLVALDALRGFAMFWIVGGDAFGGAFAHLDAGPLGDLLAKQFEHSAWAGFTFYDLIFPLFVFVLGAAIPFSLPRLVAERGRAAALGRVARRSALLIALGWFYYGGVSGGFSQIRLLGVLQRLGLCYFFASVLFVALRPRALVLAGAALLAGYWALMTFVPVPGFGAGDFAEGHNLANWLDAQWLPGRKHDGDHDVEGLLSTLPAIGSCLLGVLAGVRLRITTRTARQKAAEFAVAGALLLVAGFAWGGEFPVIKKLWTSSFVLVAGGWSVLLLAAFLYAIDVRRWRVWAAPFEWVGANALAIYLICNVADFRKISARLAGGEVAAWLDARWTGLGGVLLTFLGAALCVALCRLLHQRRLFLRL